jgi:hypothetical protein
MCAQCHALRRNVRNCDKSKVPEDGGSMCLRNVARPNPHSVNPSTELSVNSWSAVTLSQLGTSATRRSVISATDDDGEVK